MTGLRKQQPVHELQDRCLAGSASTHQRHHFTTLDAEVEMLEDRTASGPAVRHVTKFDGGHRGGAIFARRPAKFDREVHPSI
jgi:hypothetical protein